jgi:hypothetical protein
LYLRPDPARVVARPFKPAIDGTSIRPTRRAPIISWTGFWGSSRPLRQQLKDVLESFEGRHRNLLDIFEARAVEM